MVFLGLGHRDAQRAEDIHREEKGTIENLCASLCLLRVSLCHNLLKLQYFIIAEILVAARNDLFARLQSVEHFVVFGVFAAQGDGTLYGPFARFVHDINPVAAGVRKNPPTGISVALAALPNSN